LFLNSDGRERKGKLRAFGVALPSSSEGYAEGYADERGIVAALSRGCGTMISLRFILLIMVDLGSRFQVSPAKGVGGLAHGDRASQKVIGRRILEVTGMNE
jgi:hypothetical protein